MFSKSVLAFALLAVSRLALAAQPPACLLAAINSQPDPADMAKVCGKGSDVQQTITDVCKSNAQEALKAFADTCKSNGVTVSAISVSPSASASGSKNGTSPASKTVVYATEYLDEECSCTKTTSVSTVVPASSANLVSATASPSGPVETGSSGGSAGGSSGASASKSGAGLPTATGAAGKIEGGSFAAVAVAAAGLVAVL